MQQYADLAAQQQSQLLGSAPAQEAAKQRGASQQFAATAAGEPLPKMAPHIEKGAGFLHNLGQALQMISMATGPGRAVFGPQGPVYGPNIEKYRATQAGLMGQRQAAESSAEGAEKEVTALAGPAGRAIYGGSQIIGKEVTATQRAQAVMTQHQDKLAQIAAMKDINARNNAAKLEVTQMHDDMMREITGMKDVTEIEKANIMAGAAQTILNTKIAEDPSIVGYVKQLFGVGGMQAPGGAAPVRENAPAPKRSAAPVAGAVPKGSIVYDPQGTPHTSDGTHPLPKGWATQKPGKKPGV
jgi:hypothetical protein